MCSDKADKVSVFALLSRVLMLRCPSCGEGALFISKLKMRESCSECGFNISKADPADGPAYVVMCIIGTLVTAGAVWYEFAQNPPFLYHAIIWPVFSIFASYFMLKWVKACFVAMYFRYINSDAKN